MFRLPAILALLSLLLFAAAPASAVMTAELKNRSTEIFWPQNDRASGDECPASPDRIRDAAIYGYDFALDVSVGPNLYAYVKQNPWSGFDPDGLQTSGPSRTPARQVRDADPPGWMRTFWNKVGETIGRKVVYRYVTTAEAEATAQRETSGNRKGAGPIIIPFGPGVTQSSIPRDLRGRQLPGAWRQMRPDSPEFIETQQRVWREEIEHGMVQNGQVPNRSASGQYSSLRPNDPVGLQSPARTLVKDSNGRFWLQSSDGSRITPSGRYDFVTQNGTVRVVRPNTDPTLSTHMGLSNGGTVQYAGSVSFANGNTATRGSIRSWDNNSGHYKPLSIDSGNAGLPQSSFSAH